MNQQSAKSRTLILVNHPGLQKRQDFEEIRAKIDALAPEIDVQIVEAGQSVDEFDDDIWQRPCLVVSFAGIPIPAKARASLLLQAHCKIRSAH